MAKAEKVVSVEVRCRDRFSPSNDKGSMCGGEGTSKTKQSEKDRCDVNKILKRFHDTGVIQHVNQSVAQYGDFSRIQSYQDAIKVVEEADRRFTQLPSWLRNRFGNDPGRFVQWASDPRNLPEMVELGLAEKRKGAPTRDVSPSQQPGSSPAPTSAQSKTPADKPPGS